MSHTPLIHLLRADCRGRRLPIGACRGRVVLVATSGTRPLLEIDMCIVVRAGRRQLNWSAGATDEDAPDPRSST
jgi:hypothetical protein